MKQYELVVIVDGKSTAAKRKTSLEKVEKLVKTLEGKVLEALDWGQKELSYPIKKATTGAYTIFQLELSGAAAKAINERLRLEDDIIRYLLMTKEPKLVRIKNRYKELVDSTSSDKNKNV